MPPRPDNAADPSLLRRSSPVVPANRGCEGRTGAPRPGNAVRTRARAALCAGLAVNLLAAGCSGVRLERQREWVRTHPQAPGQIKRAVLGKKLIQGMTTDAVRASWGDPDDVIDLGGADARWTYDRRQDLDGVHVNVEYTLVFNRGVLIRIHQQKYR